MNEKHIKSTRRILQQNNCEKVHCIDCPSSMITPQNDGNICGNNDFYTGGTLPYKGDELTEKHRKAFENFLNDKHTPFHLLSLGARFRRVTDEPDDRVWVKLDGAGLIAEWSDDHPTDWTGQVICRLNDTDDRTEIVNLLD